MALTRIETGLLANNSVTGTKIALGTITGDDIAVGQITGNLLTANCVTAGNNITGTLAAFNGGTGLTAPGTTGNVLTSNGTTWISSKASGGSGAGGSVLTGTQTLTSSSDGAINIGFTAAGQSITLPNATTLSEAALLYQINNTSAFIGILYDAAGSILGFIPASSSILIGLADNTTSAGTWIVNGHQTLGVTSELGSSLFSSSFQVIDLGSSRYLLYSTTGSMVVYNSSSNTIGTAYTPPIASYDITVLDTDKLLIMYPDSTGSTTAYNVRVLTISGTTITAQTAYTTSNSFTNSQSPSYFNIVSLSSTLAVMHYNSSSASQGRLQAVSISGNACTIGTAQGFGLTQYGYCVDIAKYSATQFIAYNVRSGAYGGMIGGSVSGTTITLDGNGRTDNLGYGLQSDEQFTTGEFGVGKKSLFRTLGNGRLVFATQAASGQGTYADVYCCSVSGSDLAYSTLRVDSGEQMGGYAIYPLTSSTFFFAWRGNSDTSFRLTHVTNTTGNTLTRDSGNEITVVPTSASGSPLYFKATSDGAYMIARSYGTTPTYSVAKFTLSGTTPTLTSRKDVSLGRLGSSGSLTTALLGISSSNTKAHLVSINGSVESNLNFTSFKELPVGVYSVIDQAARVIPVGTKSIYVSAAGSLKVLEASK
jgi:hypothetical protein